MKTIKYTGISICIPAYERTDFLKRLLDSIAIQTFKYFEVIISDDSKSEKNKTLVEDYKHLNVTYVRNSPSLGSPKNWNNAISLAKYEWIKIMHDDDYFTNEYSLEIFSKHINKNNKYNFIFSSHILLNEISKTSKEKSISAIQLWWLKKSRSILFYKNIIGHPSCTLYKKDSHILFDNKFKWVVDVEFYLRYINTHNKVIYIKEPLVVVSENDSQITKSVFRNKSVEIPENLILLNKHGENLLSNIIVFDYYWRLFRNLEIKEISQIQVYKIPISKYLIRIFNFQNKFSVKFLKIGIFSKITMLYCFIKIFILDKKG